MGCCGKMLVALVAINLALIYLPGIPPFDVKFEEVNIERIPLNGKLKVNNRLDDYELLPNEIANEGILEGAESFAYKDGYIYSGIIGGDIIRLNLNDLSAPWKKVFHYGEEDCHFAYEVPKCGRPAGIAFDSKGRLVVADVHLGIYRIDFDKNSAEMLVSSDTVTEGKATLFPNSVAVGKNDEIYYTVFSTKYPPNDFMLIMLEYSSPSGRLLKYDSKTKVSTVLVEDLVMANGLSLSKDEDFVVFSDMGKPKLQKYYLKGPKKGQVETFAKTPGLTDNIKPNGKGGFIAAHIISTFEGAPNNPIMDFLKYPRACRYLVRIIWNAKNVVKYINENVVETTLGKYLDFYLANPEPFTSDEYGFLSEYDQNGNVIQTWQSPDSKVSGVTEGYVVDGYLYLGTFNKNHVMRVKY